MAPLASGVPMGASHGIGYVLGAAFGIPHGHTSCIMLPAVMRWNRAANAERQVMVAAAMGRPDAEAAEALHALIAGLGMPRSLGAVGIVPDAFARIAERAMATPWVPRNPRRIEGPAQVTEILELAA
jgi:alcohol dehydrogenase class IV